MWGKAAGGAPDRPGTRDRIIIVKCHTTISIPQHPCTVTCGWDLEGRHPEADLSRMLENFIYGIYMAYIWPGSATGAFPNVLRPSPGPPDDRRLPRVHLSSKIEPRAGHPRARPGALAPPLPPMRALGRHDRTAGPISELRRTLGSHRSSGGSGEGRGHQGSLQ